MEPTSRVLIALLPVCLFLLCGTLAFGVAGFLVFRTVRRAQSMPRVDRETFLTQVGEMLLPWGQDAFKDLAAHWRGNWMAVGVRGYF